MDDEVLIEDCMSRNRMVGNAQGACYKSLAETIEFWVKGNRSELHLILSSASQ